jgi:hypothetical protein
VSHLAPVYGAQFEKETSIALSDGRRRRRKPSNEFKASGRSRGALIDWGYKD